MVVWASRTRVRPSFPPGPCAELVSEITANAQNDDFLVELLAFEQILRARQWRHPCNYPKLHQLAAEPFLFGSGFAGLMERTWWTWSLALRIAAAYGIVQQ